VRDYLQAVEDFVIEIFADITIFRSATSYIDLKELNMNFENINHKASRIKHINELEFKSTKKILEFLRLNT